MVSNIDIEVRKKLIETYVWNVALYGCEAWTIDKGERRRSEAFAMYRYRKLLKISWVGKVTNEKVLNLVKEKRSSYASKMRRRVRLILDIAI